LILAANSRADQFDILRLTWQTSLINNGGSLSSITNTAISDWSSMDTNASRTYLWSDLPFGSDSANIVSTFQRLQAMALAWAAPGSSLQGDAALAGTVASGLDWMNANVYTTSAKEYDNWFHWEDSGPQTLNNTEVLLYSALTSTQISNYCAAVDHYGPVDYPANGATFGWMTGANTADKVLVVGIRAILGKSSSLLTIATNNLSPVLLYVTHGDGFYTDGSFVFHSNGSGVSGIAYNGHYGLVLLGDIPTIVDLFNGSAWQITDPGLTNVYNWAVNSFEPLVYGGAIMDMVRGRIVSWSYETESEDASSTISAIRQIAQFAPGTIATALNHWANSPQAPLGQYHFPSMDRELALRSGFGFGISMYSTLIANYESINSGNLHGWHQGDGMTYLYIGSTENQFDGDFWPTVDPYHLPGTTAETNSLNDSASEAQTSDQNWVGGAQVANTYGVAGMSLHAVNTTLYAKKTWFMFDNEIVCLGAGITCGDSGGVHTTAENRRLGNPITSTFTLNGASITPTVGWTSNLPSALPSWCALGGTGGYYFPAGNSNLQATFVQNTGSWSQIDSGDSGTVDTDDYFKLWFNHGLQPTNASYAYVILPNMSAGSVSNYSLNPDIIILANTPSVQAVKKPALGVVAASFWTNGNSSADLISVNNKSSVITWETATNISVGISDSTQTNAGSINVTLNQSASSVLSADSGVTVVQLSPQIILSVNVNGSHGRSFQASFQLGSPVVAIIAPATNIVYLSTTNQTLLLTATASNTLPANVMITLWSQTAGPGPVNFGNSNGLTTTANFIADGTYDITFTASNGKTSSVSLVIVVNSSIGAVTNGLLGWWKMDETGGTTAFDSSGIGANATVHGGTFTTGYLSSALYLAGGTNNATFTSVDAAQTTVTAWVYADGNGGSSFPRILVMPGCYLNFRFDGSANNNALDFATTTTANGSTVDGEWLAPPDSIGTGAWYHVAVSYDKTSTGNLPALYVNGVKMSLATLTSPTATPPSNAGITFIGNRLDLTRGWDGLIDDLRIYNRLLSDAEVQALALIAAPNLAPTVNAGTNQTVILPAPANLNGTATGHGNPPGPVTLAWSEASGPGTIAFANSNALATTASFSAAGNYQLQLAADDGQVTTLASVTVTAITPPNLGVLPLSGAFQLSWPANDGNWQLQYQTNSLGTNWQNIPGTITNPFVAPIDPAAGSVFYRLLLMNN
jgi:hyaluronate lyase